MKTIQAVRGMHDITPDQSGHWSRIENAIAQVFNSYAYREIRMPIVESTRLFHRSIGEVTDIVEKEMYTFPDRNDELLSLRPEGTAGCVRAVIENGLLNTPQKLWYNGPMFRYEKPQKGRHRQFHQIGAEVFGYADVEVEAEMLMMNQRFWKALGLEQTISLQLNNIGDSEARGQYRQALIEYLSAHKSSLDADSLRRLETNPLRILDSKNPQVQSVLQDAPQMTSYLSDQSQKRVEQLNALLAAGGIDVQHNSRLVRGLDYYNDTVFEWVSDDLGAQGTVCGGGRYDGLVEQLGGKPMPAIGFAMGLERLYLLLEAQTFSGLPGSDAPDIFFVVAGEALQGYAFAVAERLRNANATLSIMHNLTSSSMKSQFKRADKSGARFAIVIGESEAANQQVTVKDLDQGEQMQCDIADSVEALLQAVKSE